MLIRLIENVTLPQYGCIPAGFILNFPDAVAIQLLNSTAAVAVRSAEPREVALKP